MTAARYSIRYVVHIVTILILWKLSGINVEAVDTSGKHVERKLFKAKIVYDVSQAILRNETQNQTNLLPEHLYVWEEKTSAKYYFVANGNDLEEFCWQGIQCKYWKIQGISLIFGGGASKHDVLATKNVPVTYTTIVNFLQQNESSIDSLTIMLYDVNSCAPFIDINGFFKDMQISGLKQSTRVGIEYSDALLERCVQEGFPLFDYLDHTILRIHVSPLTTMLSYATFFEKVQGLIEKNRQLVQELNPQSTPYIRLHNVDWNTTISAENYEKYNALMTRYLDAFSKQNKGNEVFILSPTLKQLKYKPNDVYFRQSVTVQYFYSIEGERFPVTSPQDRHLLDCAHQRMVNFLHSNVQNVLVYDPFLEVLGSLSARCILENQQSHFTSSSANTSLSLLLGTSQAEQDIDEQVENIIQLLQNSSAATKIARVYLLGADLRSDNDSLTKAAILLESQNIDAGCIAFAGREIWSNISAIVNNAVSNCDALMHMSKEIVVDVTTEIVEPQDFLNFLVRLDQAKRQFEELYPGKQLTWSIIFRGVNLIKQESPYCNAELKRIKEYFETVYSFANIQGWSRLVLKHDESGSGLWSYVTADEQIDPSRLKYLVLFRTNASPTVGKQLPMTYPCIERTQDAKKSQINFSENPYSGATFQTNLREKAPLSTTEVQVLLELAMTRFPFVEIIAASKADFEAVEKVVGTDHPSYRHQNVSTPSVYIEVPLADAVGLRQQVNRILSNKHTAIHVSNWESSSQQQLNMWKGFQPTSKFGITVQNCSREMDSKVDSLKSLPFMPQVSYIVCNTPPVSPDNKQVQWMEAYLGTLVYTKSYMEHYLSFQNEGGNEVEVMFRLNYVCSKRKEVEKFLRFLNDVNQHSAAYKIRYFIVRAFETETSADCLHSWWRPDSYADLSNISHYVNREDEYAGREARYFPPPVPPPAPTPEENSNAVYYFTVVPIVTLLVLVILALLIYQRMLKTRILTQAEIRHFYNGDEQSSLITNANGDYLDFGNMKFPKHYEIPRNDIETEEIIGSGQFGVVHRGILSKSTEVAIKIPRSGCGKEQFKSTLSELKILCHIGEHLNIVSFLGAHTKGIANGKLQIVIEYCKNGCLLKHLRQNQENARRDSSLSLFELCGFSHQIASGMEYIAEKRVIHGDLAARNVLLTSEFTCKIADFGLSRRLYEMNEYVKTSQEPLPWRWMAPESLRNMEFTTKSDVWSYGITLWEIFSLGMVPYPGLNWTVNYVNELENGMRMGKAPHATDDIHAKTLECWNMNSEARPTFTELKEYFVGLRNEEYLNLNRV